MNPEARMYWLSITSPKVGRKKQIVNTFVVLATDAEQAVAVFDEEYGRHHRDGCVVFVEPYFGRVARIA